MSRNTFLLTLIVALAGAFPGAGCGEDDEREVAEGGAGGDGPLGEWYGDLCGGQVAALGEVAFQPCTGAGAGLNMECARVTAPLEWCDEGSERIELFIRRLRSTVEPSLGQVWLLNGGPGFPGDPLLGTARFYLEQGLDVLLPDYRGVGQSTDLNCAGHPAGGVDDACMAELLARWGEGLRHFDTTQTAIDLAQLIHRLRLPDERVFIWANSYGTFLANRYLSLFPSESDGVILDGVCPATGCDVRNERNADALVRRVLAYCGEDPVCSTKLGADPAKRLEGLFESVRGGHCSDSFGADTESVLEEIISMSFSDKLTIAAGLAFIYRLERCDPDDIKAMRRLLLGPSADTSSFGIAGSQSTYLFFNVVFAEFWDEALTPEKAAAEGEHYFLNLGTTEGMAKVRSSWAWPVFRTPERDKHWAKTDTPLLILNGTLDSQTTVEGLAGIDGIFSRPDQTFVSVPWAGHLTLFSSSVDPNREDRCVGTLVRRFFAEPAAILDTSCIDDISSPSLGANPEMASYLFGTADIWENEGAAVSAWSPAARTFPTLRELRERARRSAFPWLP